jgi:hypothetical protein
MYHSALKSFSQHDTESYGFKTTCIEALIFDIENDTIPTVFYDAEFVYLEFPYRSGYDVFNNRVNKKGVGFGYLQFKTLEILEKLNKPFYIIAEKRMPILKPLLVKRIYYSAHKCDTYLYSNKPIKAKSTNELQSLLFETYDIGLDFMCGYGNLVNMALKHNKKIIISDYNPKCLGYIYENLQKK